MSPNFIPNMVKNHNNIHFHDRDEQVTNETLMMADDNDDGTASILNPDSTSGDPILIPTDKNKGTHDKHPCQAERIYLTNGTDTIAREDIANREPILGSITIPTVTDASSTNHFKDCLPATTNNNVHCATYQQIVTGANNTHSNWGLPQSRRLQGAEHMRMPRQREHFFHPYYNDSMYTQPNNTDTDFISSEVTTQRNKDIVNDVVAVQIFPILKFFDDNDFRTKTEEKNHMSKVIVDYVGKKGLQERTSFWLGYKEHVRKQIMKLRTTTITSMKKRYTDCKCLEFLSQLLEFHCLT
jgi:hypothetical protein